VNRFGVFHLCRALLPHMLERGSGTIVNISSGAASRPLEGWNAYCMGKAAAAMFTRALVHEYGRSGLRIYDFIPGVVAADMQVRIRASGVNEVSRLPLDRLIPPADPARVIAYLCSPAAADLPSGAQSIRDAALRARVGLPEHKAA
jgi:NAD(P)-dependent dehydrogenase (short-subunit alcohol dehydrogenase family)